VRVRDLFIGLLKVYQRAVSPWLGDCCRFTPSCSAYMIGSISKNGVFLGVLSGAWRVLRCNPLHPGGQDEPREIQLFGTRERWKKE
jgi:putative membrane protein insertion efficiency factor